MHRKELLLGERGTVDNDSNEEELQRQMWNTQCHTYAWEVRHPLCKCVSDRYIMEM